MDHWLVTFSASLAQDARLAIIEEAGARATPGGPPVPLGDEVAVQVEADKKAVAALRAHEKVIGVFPDSELTLY